MTDKQIKFVNEYLKDNNGSQAAIRAGFNESNSRQYAYQLLNKPEIAAEIQRRREEIDRLSNIDLIFVRQRLKEIADKCSQVEPVMTFNGEEWVESGEYKFDSSGAIKSIELLGKIIGAFEKDNSQKNKDIVINIDKEDEGLGE